MIFSFQFFYLFVDGNYFLTTFLRYFFWKKCRN